MLCLTRGGLIKLRAINTSHEVPMVSTDLPPRKWGSLKYRGKKKDDICVDHVQDDVLYWSEQANFPEIEGFAIFSGNTVCMFQSTVSEERELNVSRIDHVLKAINNFRNDITRVQIWYLVPPRVFSTFSVSMPAADEELPSEIAFGDTDIPLDFVVGSLPDLDEKDH